MMKTIFAGLIGIMIATSAMANDFYATGTVGTQTRGSDTIVGLAIGSELNKNLRVEGAYDYNVDTKTNRVFVHALPQARIPGTALTPYALAGVGVDLDSLQGKTLYALGAGVRVELTKVLDFDLRYRRVDNTDNSDKREVVTAGISVKF